MGLRLLAMATVAIMGLVGATASIRVQAGIIKGMPDAIVCSVEDSTGVLPWEQLVFYVSARMRNGDTLYKSATSDPVVLLVNSKGIINGPNLADCDGRRIESLQQEGRALTLTQPPSGQGSDSP